MFPAMTGPENQRHTPTGGTRHPSGRPLRPAVIITVVGAVVFAGATFALLREPLSTTVAEIAAVVALGAFGVTVYGLLRSLLTMIESAGERRRQEREATERRHGDRVKKPD
jgi:drug/metabolite transporter (DMT)-like permease